MSARSRSGAALVEVFVAITVMGIAVTGLAGMTFWVARRGVAATLESGRVATAVQQVDRLSVLPWDSLPSRAGCASVASGPFLHTRCVTVTDVTATRRRVSIVITPANPLVRPDTIVLDRAKGAPYNPLM